MSGSLAGVCVPDDPDSSMGSVGGDQDDSSTPIPFGDTGAVDSDGEDASTGSGADDSSGSSDGAPQLLFVDDDAGDFGAGHLGATEFSDGLRLQADATKGVFDSQLFDAGESVRWDSLSWTPRAPYAKPSSGGAPSRPHARFAGAAHRRGAEAARTRAPRATVGGRRWSRLPSRWG